jgi:hypothetical protein
VYDRTQNDCLPVLAILIVPDGFGEVLCNIEIIGHHLIDDPRMIRSKS